MVSAMNPPRRGVHLEYRFEATPADQRGAVISNPLIDLLRTLDQERARVSAAPTLADALAGAAWMQENAPERLEVKRQLWAEIDATAALGRAQRLTSNPSIGFCACRTRLGAMGGGNWPK